MESKSYKNLGNAIRESVFNIKEAPTMLPDETIEKLGLSEDDILLIEEDPMEEDQQLLVESLSKLVSPRSTL
jgi:hypothetical protein